MGVTNINSLVKRRFNKMSLQQLFLHVLFNAYVLPLAKRITGILIKCKTIVWKQLDIWIKFCRIIIFIQNARASFASVPRFCFAIGFWLSNQFCVSGYRKRILVLISSCMRPAQDSISIWYHIVVYRFSHRIGHELPTNANGRALAAQCTTKRRYTTRFVSGGGSTRRRVYIFVCMLHACTSVSERGLWCNSVNKENSRCTCLPSVHPIFSVRWSASCRQLNHITYIKIFAFALRVCKWAISAVYYNWYRSSYTNHVNRDGNFSPEILLFF